jgi:hypothetical protein
VRNVRRRRGVNSRGRAPFSRNSLSSHDTSLKFLAPETHGQAGRQAALAPARVVAAWDGVLLADASVATPDAEFATALVLQDASPASIASCCVPWCDEARDEPGALTSQPPFLLGVTSRRRGLLPMVCSSMETQEGWQMAATRPLKGAAPPCSCGRLGQQAR